MAINKLGVGSRAGWLCVAGVAWACGASTSFDPGPASANAGASGAASGAGAGANGGSSGASAGASGVQGGSANRAGSAGAAGSVATSGSGGDFGSSGAAGIGGTCILGSTQATVRHLTMFVLFDDSGSMADNNKWTLASSALRTFFASPSAAGMNVWLRLFPEGNCSKTSCDAEQSPYPLTAMACATPTVALGTLTGMNAPADAQEQALLSALTANATLGGGSAGTPMSAALDGAESAAVAYAQANPTNAADTVVVLVTDGTPNGCAASVTPDIANIAGAALATSGIKTYAFGLQGSNQTDLDAIAMAGGTASGVFIGNAADTQAALLSAFGSIQASNGSCDFDVPAPPVGGTLDPSKVNLVYTSSSGSSVTLGKVASAAACAASQAWYYDASETHITLCPSACQTVQGDPAGKLDVLVGCDDCPTCLPK